MTGLVEARRDAEQIVRLLQPACERLAVAGSLRRECDRVRDLDLVLVPKLLPTPGRLFDDGELVPALDDLLARTIAHRNAGLTRPRDAKNGPRHKELRYGRRKVELWIVLPPATWGVIFALRTGPADFSRLLVTAECYGGAMPVDHRVTAGRLMHAGRQVPTAEESDFFRALDLPTLPPRERTAESLSRLLSRRNQYRTTTE
ncbi:MAG: hypothetical protein WBC44_00425 [Planctomycetaceae bacterium]